MKEMKKAAALAWSREYPAPYVLASGRGHMAASMLAQAEFHSVPVVRDSVLADVLADIPPGAYIPEKTWKAVAAVFSFLDGIAEKRLFA